MIAILIPAGLFLLATAIIKTVYGAPIGWGVSGAQLSFRSFLDRSIGWRTSSSTGLAMRSGGAGSRCHVCSPLPEFFAPAAGAGDIRDSTRRQSHAPQQIVKPHVVAQRIQLRLHP